MEFSQNESEEVSKLKRQLVEERLHSSQLKHTQSKLIAENKSLSENVKQCQTSFDESTARLDKAERDQESIRDERDRLKLSNANLLQSLTQVKIQLSQKNKFDRFKDDEKEDSISRREKELVQEVDRWQKQCNLLEIRLKDDQQMINVGSSSLHPAKLLSLENEIITLKSENERLRQANTMQNQTISDTDLSNTVQTDREQQQLRELNSELNQQIEIANERALRAEREALVASNERLAIEKRTKSSIESLESARDDLKEEVKVREVNISELEKQLHEIQTLLEIELDSPLNDLKEKLSELIQDGKDLKSIRTVLMKWRADYVQIANKANLPESVSDLAAKIVKAYVELDFAFQTTRKRSETDSLYIKDLQKQLQELSQASKALKMREKEMVKAKGRLKLLSGSLQKALPLAAGLQSVMSDASISGAGGVSFSSIGDETVATGNESIFGGLRGFESDLVDEMEQLITYVEDLDNRLEFQRVEQEIREMSAINDRDKLKIELSILEKELLEVKISMQNSNESYQIEIDRLQEEKQIAVNASEEISAIAQQQREKNVELEKKLKQHELRANQEVENLLQLLDKFHRALQDENLRWQNVSKLQSVDLTLFASNLIKTSKERDTLQRTEIDQEREKVCQMKTTLSVQEEQFQVEKQDLVLENQNIINAMKEELENWRAQIEEKAQKEEEQSKVIKENALILVQLQEELIKEREKVEILRQDWKALEMELVKDNSIKDQKLEEAQIRIESFKIHDQSSSVNAKEKEMIEALSVAQSTIQHLEHELAIKSQECEDADDKEIALRKDNKRLLSRIATMQARVEKLQQELQQKKAMVSIPSDLPKSQICSVELSKEQPLSTRKRRNSDMEEKYIENEQITIGKSEELSSSKSKIDRAYIYAPGPTSMTINATSQGNNRNRSSPALKVVEKQDNQIFSHKNVSSIDETNLKQKISSSDEISAIALEGQQSFNRSQSRSGTSSKPSDLVALRLQQKMNNQTSAINPSIQNSNPVRIKDRTNKPRENVNNNKSLSSATQKDSSSDNNFMAKINRYRTPSGNISTTMQDHSRAVMRS